MAAFLITDVRIFDGQTVIDRGSVLISSGKITKKHGIELPPNENPLKTQEHGHQFVRDQIGDGADYIKILHESGTAFGMELPKLPTVVERAIVEEAHRSGLTVVAHAFTLEDTLEVLSLGIDGTAHTVFDKPPTSELIEAFQKNGAFCNPTLAVIGSNTEEGRKTQERYAHDPRVHELLVEGGRDRMCQCLAMTNANDGSLRNAIDTVKRLKEAGIDIVCGTDSTGLAPGTAYGLSLHQELELLVKECGFPPIEALRATTSLPAKRFNFSDRGWIREGMRADLVLVEGDPTNDIYHTLDLRATNAFLYNETIQTKYGAVKGVPALNATCCSYLPGYESVTVWRGIPFATNTGGQNRFKPPQPREPWNETYIASDFGSACPAGAAPYGGPDTEYDEDCLNLNIWSSANSTAQKRPVMIWSYPAGANGAWTMFDGSAMTLQDVVVITYNYRTGPYGWLALPELYEESGNLTTGNYGFLDQAAALKWSAGSAAVYHTVNSPLTKGYIVGAIAESGIRDPRDPASTSLAEGYNNLSTSVKLSRELMTLLNITTLEELRTIPTAKEINNASTFTSFSNWRSTLDGYAMTMTYWEQLQNGPANDVPFMTGNTKDESGAAYGTNTTVSQYESALSSTYGDFAARFIETYPASNDTEASMNTNLIARDASNVGSCNFGRYWSGSASSPFYTYYWDHAPPGQDQGAHHMSEINYVFNNLYGTDLPWTDIDYQIATTLNAYWANFVKTQNPNKGNSYKNGTLAYWAPHGSVNATVFHLSPPAPTNPNGLPVGYQQVPIATEEHVKLFQDFFNSRTPETL
ncbi:MAG: hypothetical protein M1820_002358 [Bogoriella megaspora]|nr:MAG: hypothetical protein M1820_002358 [Bogoriella megaspora]